MKILILGATGLLGQHLFTGLETDDNYVFGTVRDLDTKKFFSINKQKNLVFLKSIFNLKELKNILEYLEIETVINCISISNITEQSIDTLNSVFSDFPKELGRICFEKKIRIIQISTDGVFSGKKGNYTEEDIPDPIDTYGNAKLSGELKKPNQITLRLSMIGHDHIKKQGLLEWFLTQKKCSLYSNYIFSGLTTNELTRIIRDYILVQKSLYGLYHVPSKPISKYDLLKLVAENYNCKVKLKKNETIKMNRTLCGTKFFRDTGYTAPTWKKLIYNMKLGKY